MAEINFKDSDLRCLVIEHVLVKAVELVNNTVLDHDVSLNFVGCYIDYGVHKILDCAIKKMQPLDGKKIIRIKHDLLITDQDQLSYYTFKKSDSVANKSNSFKEFSSAIKAEYGIDLLVEGA